MHRKSDATCQPEPLFAFGCTHEDADDNAEDHQEDSEENVSSRRHPERVPVQRRVTVGRVRRILREFAERRIDPNISCTRVIYNSLSRVQNVLYVYVCNVTKLQRRIGGLGYYKGALHSQIVL